MGHIEDNESCQWPLGDDLPAKEPFAEEWAYLCTSLLAVLNGITPNSIIPFGVI
jgi:hypothetical protein